MVFIQQSQEHNIARNSEWIILPPSMVVFQKAPHKTLTKKYFFDVVELCRYNIFALNREM